MSKQSATKPDSTSSARSLREQERRARATVANAMESISLAFDNMEPTYRMMAIAECLRRLAQRAANEAAKISGRNPPKTDKAP